jgi:hypothetical protein
MSVIDLRELPGFSGAPAPGGRPNAQPGSGRASGAAQRRRLIKGRAALAKIHNTRRGWNPQGESA